MTPTFRPLVLSALATVVSLGAASRLDAQPTRTRPDSQTVLPRYTDLSAEAARLVADAPGLVNAGDSSEQRLTASRTADVNIEHAVSKATDRMREIRNVFRVVRPTRGLTSSRRGTRAS